MENKNTITENPSSQQTPHPDPNPTPIPTEPEILQFLSQTCEKLNTNPNIVIYSKILHYNNPEKNSEKNSQKNFPPLFYVCKLKKNTILNPYNLDIKFGYEFIEAEIPYITILTTFTDPSLNDNRNFFYCLSKNFDYKFNLEKIEEHVSIITEIINNTPTFLNLLKICYEINSFIYFGEYQYNHLYLINDFLQGENILEFFRIKQFLGNNKFEEKFIIVTKLYFLFIEPDKTNKALGYIKYYKKLKDLELNYEKGENSLILKINSKKIKKIEFNLIDRKNKENIENNNFSIFLKNMFLYQDKIDFNKYNIVIRKYKFLFNHDAIKVNNANVKKNRKKIKEFENLIFFHEKLLEYYEKKRDKEKINNCLANIVFLCTELVSFHDNTDKVSIYLKKMKNYVDILTNNKK